MLGWFVVSFEFGFDFTFTMSVGVAGSAEMPLFPPGGDAPAAAGDQARAVAPAAKASPATLTIPPGSQPSAPVPMSDGTPSALPFMVPAQDEVDAMLAGGGKVSALMAWAEVDAHLGARFLTKELGVGADDHWGVMAGFTIDELDDLLATMKYNGESLRLGVKAKLRNVF